MCAASSGDRVYETMIPRNVRVSEAPVARQAGAALRLQERRCPGLCASGRRDAAARAAAGRRVTADGKAQRRRGLGMGLSALLGDGAEAYAPESLRGAAAERADRVPAPVAAAAAPAVRRGGAGGAGASRSASTACCSRCWCARRQRCRRLRDRRRRAPLARGAARRACTRCRWWCASCRDQETLELALIENLQRADLSPLEEAQAFRRLIDEFGHTQDELATGGRQEPQPCRQHAAAAGAAGAGAGAGRGRQPHRRPCPRADRLRRRRSGWPAPSSSAGSTCARPRRWSGRDAKPRGPRGAGSAIADPHARELEQRLTERLGLEVGIRAKARGGLLTIRYHDLGQLDGLIRRLQ